MEKSRKFWESLGFLSIKTALSENGKEIFVYEKLFLNSKTLKKTSRRKLKPQVI